MPVRLTSTPGCASRCFSVGISVCPPASAWASSAPSAATASATVVGPHEIECVHRLLSYAAAIAAQTRAGDSGMSIWSTLMPAAVQRVEHRVDQRRRRADRAGLAAALHPERVVGAGRDAGMVDR